MYRRKFLCCAVLLMLCSLAPVGALAVSESNRVEITPNLPFASGEELVYEGEFTKALLRGIDIADLRFTAALEPAAARASGASASGVSAGAGTGRSLRLTVDAVSKGLLRKLFGVRFHQHIESLVDPGSFAVLQTTKLDEQGERRRTSEAVFDRTAGKVVWTERDPNNPQREPRVISSPFTGTVQDLASVFYFLRTQPLALGQSMEVTVSDSGRVYRVPHKVTERKKMKTVVGEVSVLKVEPEIFGEGRLLQGRGKMYIWFTDDARRIPVRAHISNEMGTLDIKLKSIKLGPKS
ncbi:MAG TPA: DUF3108 domain-containing protein [Pyrinomonadaceae bacterium]